MPALSEFQASASAPSIADLLPRMRTLARTLPPGNSIQLRSTTAATNFSTSAIAYIVCLGIVPVIVVTCVIIWALCFYGRNRACCPCCAKRKDTDERKLLRSKSRESGTGSHVSEDTTMRELPAQRMGMNRLQKQSERPPVVAREDSGLSSVLGQERVERPPSLRRFV